ncbi:MAG TPA: LOG family protein [Xanthobacteraceae bacterium]
MKDNADQKNSPSYLLAALDRDFLLGDSTRGVRLQLEYEKAEERLRAWVVRSTIVVFGSARVLPGGSDDEALSTAPLPPGAVPRPGGKSARWYNEARRFGLIASERGGALQPNDRVRDNVIATGGGPGIMEAANRGAWDAGAPSIGFNIGLPREQDPNAYSTPDLTFQFHYFAVRKLHFAMRANALVIFPGGFGTFDELFELLTLMQTAKMPAIPVVLVDKAYWTGVINFTALVDEGMIAPFDLDLFSYADDAESAWHELVRRGLNRGPRPAGYPSQAI